MKWFAWLLSVLALAAVVHFATILAIPHLAPRDAWSRVMVLAPERGFFLLPEVAPGSEALPFLDPTIVYGICRYNLSDGPLQINADIPESYWSVAAHTRSGVVFFSVTGLASPDGTIKIELRNAAQQRTVILADPSLDAKDSSNKELRIAAPEDEGFLLFRSLVPQPSQRVGIAALADTTLCRNDPES